MRAAIILCLVAVACADKLGYNYHPVDHSDAGLSFAPGGGAGSSDVPSYAGAPSSGGPSYAGAPSSGEPSYAGAPSSGGPSYAGAPSLGGPSYAGAPSSVGPSYAGAPQGELQKEFYSYSANEDDFNEPAASDQAISSLKSNLKVVFIKGPENKGLENAVLNLAKHASDQQTAIYVLNKQADIGDLANKLNAVHGAHASKPEVHFVKYRTPQDAANAQQAIQSQYDQLGGSSQSHNGGIAPVINFASPSVSHPVQAVAPGSSYLPASILRRLRY